jgi:hypothetical protein
LEEKWCEEIFVFYGDEVVHVLQALETILILFCSWEID